MNPMIFSVLSEPTRFHIVELLRQKPQSVGRIAEKLNIRQPQTSKHLRVLAGVGIVKSRHQANKRIYALSPKKFQEIDIWLGKYRTLWDERLDALEKFVKSTQ